MDMDMDMDIGFTKISEQGNPKNVIGSSKFDTTTR